MKNTNHIFDRQLKYQKYSHYLLPISIEPLKYGKLIEQFGNKYIIQLNTSNVLVIKADDNKNFIRFYRKGDLTIEFVDSKINDKSFTRTILDQRFTFENSKLTSTEILGADCAINIFTNIISDSSIKYEDTNSIKLSLLGNNMHDSTLNSIKLSPLENMIKKLEKSQYAAEYFGLFTLFLIFLTWFVFFVLFQDSSSNTALAALSGDNIIKLRKVKSKNNWSELSFNVNNRLFSKELLEKNLNKFWNKIENNFSENNHLFILFKIKYINGEFSSIGKIQRINKADKNWYLDFILENMEFKSEYYNETQIGTLIFSYGFKDGKIKHKEDKSKNINFIELNNINLPISMNPLDFGRLIVKKDNIYILQNEHNQTINLTKLEGSNEVEFFKNGVSLIKFTDEFISENRFIRILDNKKYYFDNEKQILFTKEIKTKFISKTQKTKKIINKFLTLDIETFVHENSLVPYLICYYDGRNSYSFGLWDYDSPENMILDCLNSIFSRKYNGYSIYMHNMAKFDVIFLLKYIVKIATVQPVIHNGRIISLLINFGKNLEYKVEFKDSYLLLLSSLNKLTNGFGVNTLKSVFPFLFVNKNNLNYVSEVPDISYFDNKINIVEYKEYKSRFKLNWSLKNESIRYCKIDCISLYQVIFKFNDLIFGLFGKNVHHYPTLPSLAFAIFRSNFMEKEIVPQLSGKIANDIRTSYTGGAVDMYIPEPPKGVEIKGYDVNSLYPKQMYDRLMPIGVPTYFEGDIKLVDPNAFGFFYCKIIAPDNIKHPVIQTHVKINNMVRTIAPVGNWTDMLFSLEISNAIRLGYKFEILWGYTFEKEEIFKDYVDFLYSLRLNYPKSDPMNYIAKILLNSLYGRFGMDDNFSNINVIHKDYLADFENKFFDQIEEKIDLGDHVLVFFNELESNTEIISTHNVSIAIASAITAYARIHMSQFKNNPKINLYYTDTDSIYTDSIIDEYLIDSKVLGKLKLENICKKAIFLAPKLYCLLTTSGEFIHKVKGLKHEINLSFGDFENLLYKDFQITKSQTKWKRSLSEGAINLLDELYTLKVTENKRQLIYKNNKLIGTKPYKISENKTIIK